MSLETRDLLAAQLLRRHVRQRADRRSGLRQRRVHLRHGGGHVRIDGSLGQTEVQNLDAALRCDDDVVALQIAMDDAALVRMRERVRQLPSVVHDMLGRQRTGVQHRAERLSLDQLHGDVRLPVGLADFVHRADVRMVEGSRGAVLPAPAARAPWDRRSWTLAGP